MSEVTGPPAPKQDTPRSRPAVTPVAVPALSDNAGALQGVAEGIAAAGSGLARATSNVFDQVKERSGAAVADFKSRPEHIRWRFYALFFYAVILAGTFAAQLYTTNKIDAYIRIQKVDLPNVTQVFVRNDSHVPWRDVKVTLNGIYSYGTPEVRPGTNLILPITKFAVLDANGRPTYAPRQIEPRLLTVDCDRGHYEQEMVP